MLVHAYLFMSSSPCVCVSIVNKYLCMCTERVCSSMCICACVRHHVYVCMYMFLQMPSACVHVAADGVCVCACEFLQKVVWGGYD